MAFGQYSMASTAGARYRKGEQAPVGATEVKRVGHNRIVYRTSDGARHYRLHMTDVVTLHGDGSITLRDGGWHTITTRAAMAQGLDYFGVRAGVYGHKKPGTDHVLRILGADPIAFRCPFTFTPGE